jgi:dUTP pyrophosphatase
MTPSVRVAIKVLPEGRGLELPRYETDGAAGMDLRAAVGEDVILRPGARTRIPAGISIALPDGYEAQVRPRSGLALKRGLTLLNSPGTIDSDYRGAVGVIVVNHGNEDIVISRGDRIAQLVVAPVTRAELVEVEELPETGRGDGGFGHTG